MLLLKVLLAFQFGIGVLSQSHSCSFQDDVTGYTLSWSAGIGFVDFFFSFKKFPTRSAHWTGVGFGEETLQVALIESQMSRVTISSAAMFASQPPLKLPTANISFIQLSC
ncbi:hypothetical protein M3Y97_00870100 [Aphelenchoides bicaudatus]|nr:hypothetical protein M3Y97_00870100 [Aphelenchoides bicaudatus]